MPYTDQQIETAAKAAIRAYFGDDYDLPNENWDGVARAVLAALDVPDPGLCHWTPADGPLADALKGLPDDADVNVTQTYKAGHMRRYLNRLPEAEESILSASWQAPAPAWATPRPPLVVAAHWAETGDQPVVVWYLDADGLYHRYTDVEGMHPRDLDWVNGPIRVLIDADGNHVKADQ